MGARSMVVWSVLVGAVAACDDGGGTGVADTFGVRDNGASGGVFTDAGPALAFDPASCEDEPSSAVLVVSGLDDGALTIDGQTVVRETGAFDSVEDAVASLSFAGPMVQLSQRQVVGPLAFWEALPHDFGAVAWLDTRVADVVFAGSVVWAGQGGPNALPAETAVLVGGDPATPPAYTVVANRYWTNAAMAPDLARLGIRSEVVARYTACGEPTIVVYVYTPSVGITSPAAARGLVIVSGHRAETRL